MMKSCLSVAVAAILGSSLSAVVCAQAPSVKSLQGIRLLTPREKKLLQMQRQRALNGNNLNLTGVGGNPFRAKRPARGGFGRRGNTLIPANFSSMRDTKGFYWSLSYDGSVRSSSSSWFRTSQLLMLNGTSFSSSTRMMTPNRERYELSGSANGYVVKRYIRLNSADGYVRYIESITNPFSTRRSINLEIVTTMRYTPRAVLSSGGKTFTSTTSKKATGAILLQSRSSYPAIIQYWGSAAAPTLSIQSISSRNQQYRWRFRINLGPKQTWSIARAIALRNTVYGRNLTPDECKALMAPFESRKFLADIPSGVRRTLINVGGGGDLSVPGNTSQLLTMVNNFASRWQIDRKSDTLVVDDDTQLAGKVTAGKLTVRTRFGTADIPFADVAMLRGGNGMGQTPQVFLRNGEILVGDMELNGGLLQTNAGIPVKLKIDQIYALVMSRKKGDGVPPKEMAMLVQTQAGNRFGIRSKPPFTLSAATAWGRVSVPMNSIAMLRMQRRPHPMQLIQLQNGSRLQVLLSGSVVKVSTLRFGEISLVPITVASLARIGADSSKKVRSPHFRLVGQNILVGTFAEKSLRLRTAAGITVVKTADVKTFERDGEGNVVRIQRKRGTPVTGALVKDVVTISALGKSWDVPLRHLVSFYSPEQKKDGATETKTAVVTPPVDVRVSIAGDVPVVSEIQQPAKTSAPTIRIRR